MSKYEKELKQALARLKSMLEIEILPSTRELISEEMACIERELSNLYIAEFQKEVRETLESVLP